MTLSILDGMDGNIYGTPALSNTGYTEVNQVQLASLDYLCMDSVNFKEKELQGIRTYLYIELKIQI